MPLQKTISTNYKDKPFGSRYD